MKSMSPSGFWTNGVQMSRSIERRHGRTNIHSAGSLSAADLQSMQMPDHLQQAGSGKNLQLPTSAKAAVETK